MRLKGLLFINLLYLFCFEIYLVVYLYDDNFYYLIE